MNIIKKHWQIILILTFLFVTLALRLGRDQFLDWDECIFAQQAKEMRLTGQYITNYWNHVRLFEKPPLTNWIIASFYNFGVNEFTARIGAVFASVGIILVTYLIGLRYFNKRVAIISSLLALVAPSFITYSFRINSDIFFTLFTAVGVYLWLKVLEEHKDQNVSVLSGIFFGLAVMAKGLSIFPFIGVLFISIFLDYKRELLVEFLKMLIAFLVVILPWHLWHLVTYGQTFWQVYIVEHLLRRAQQPLDFHFEGRLFYVKLILQNYTYWLIFLLPLPIFSFIAKKKNVGRKKIFSFLKEQRKYLFIGLMVVIPLAAITQVRTRIWWYVLPIFPYLSLYLALNLDKALGWQPIKKVRVIPIVVFVLLILGVGFAVQKEVNPLVSAQGVSTRNDIFQHAAKYKGKKITYLVWFSERQAKAILPDNLHTSTTFVFGGNPCAVYYSNKKINYVYDVEEFKQRLKTQKGLFVVENGDKLIPTESNVKHTVLYNNADYTLFEVY